MIESKRRIRWLIVMLGIFMILIGGEKQSRADLIGIAVQDNRMELRVVANNGNWEGEIWEYQEEIGGEIKSLKHGIRVKIQKERGVTGIKMKKKDVIASGFERYVDDPNCQITYNTSQGCYARTESGKQIQGSIVLCCLGKPLRRVGQHCWVIEDDRLYERYEVDTVTQTYAVQVHVTELSRNIRNEKRNGNDDELNNNNLNNNNLNNNNLNNNN